MDEALGGIAIVGIAGRFPGARNLNEYWTLIREGREGIRNLTPDEVTAACRADLDSVQLSYVPRSGILETIEDFAAPFFGMSAREAEMTDPQHRLFLECCWEALENAGWDSDRFDGRVSVIAGAGLSGYLARLYSHATEARPDLLSLIISNDKDHLATRVSYKLNLRGPSLTVQTACSTSLVAVHLACQTLHTFQCDMALAGGVSVRVPQRAGYFYQEGGILSPDGRCRPFDASARGTVPGSGVGVVVLRRLEEAVTEGDHIYAVIKGSAINNDGAGKVGYTAPSLQGQAEVIAEALAMAGVDAASIGYVEAHGTATPMGDPIEVAALREVFDRGNRGECCALGAVKGNVGHLDAAAGIAGLIKAALVVEKGELPPNVNFERLNPRIELGPFYINRELRKWSGNGVRRAGVSSFGIGGTNAHVVLEEAPQQEAGEREAQWELLMISGRTVGAVERGRAELGEYLGRYGECGLQDVAYTLQERRWHRYRRALVVQGNKGADAVEELQGEKRAGCVEVSSEGIEGVVFVLGGQGGQYEGMGQELFREEEVFRDAVERCAEILKPELGFDIREAWWGKRQGELAETWVAQPAIFTMQYGLMEQWKSLGVQPRAMIGHSIGEWVAGCVAGVFSLEVGLRLVAERGRQMQQCPEGWMLAVGAEEEVVREKLKEGMEIAGVNGPRQCVVGGVGEEWKSLVEELERVGIASRRMQTRRAFHTKWMAGAVAGLRAAVNREQLRAPQILIISSVTGKRLEASEAQDSSYWSEQVLKPVEFGRAVRKMRESGEKLLWLETGPGRSLRGVLRAQVDNLVVSGSGGSRGEMATMLEAAGRLWEQGLEVRRAQKRGDHLRRRVPLPTYPFERDRFWIEPRGDEASSPHHSTPFQKHGDVSEWLYVPGWKRSTLPVQTHADNSWIVFEDEKGVGKCLAEELRSAGIAVISVRQGAQFVKLDPAAYELNAGDQSQAEKLWEDLGRNKENRAALLYCWAINKCSHATDSALEISRDLLTVLRSLPANGVLHKIVLLSLGGQDVTGAEIVFPGAALLPGLCPVIPQEFAGLSCRSIDLEAPLSIGTLKGIIAADLTGEDTTMEVAYRGRTRWVRTFEKTSPSTSLRTVLRQKGVYLITGGLGGVGLALARYLAQSVKATLVLVGRDAVQQARTETSKLMLKELSDYGATVLPISADVGDRAAISAAVRLARKTFGEIHGVIHAAGLNVARALVPIRQVDDSECARQFQAKVAGTVALDAALAHQPLDFFVATSSLATLLGGVGLGPYAAANRFMEIYVSRQSRVRALRKLTINWDGWQLAESRSENTPPAGLQNFALSPEEGARVFAAVLNCTRVPQIVVSTGDLDRRIAKWLHPSAETNGNIQAQSTHPRPELSVPYIPPRTAAEKILTEIMQRLLGVERVGVNDDFFQLGGDSLIATQFLAELRTLEQYSLPPLRSLLQSGTICKMAEILECGKESVTPDQLIATEALLLRDIHLGRDFVASPGQPKCSRTPRRVFLTGATGFIGAFLIRELIIRTEAEIWCLVRDADPDSGVKRILATMNKWAPGPEPPEGRIVAVSGDLERPSMGFRSDLFDQLAVEMDAIYHSGGLVNFVYPYTRLKPTNVEGTREVLRLATQRRVKPLHYVSTIDVFYSVNAARAAAINEGVSVRQFGAPYGGYSQSKWVAEQIVSLAGEKGVPVVIYRSGFASPDSKRAIGNTQDFLSRMIKGCILLGAAPDLELILDMTPVDFITRAVVHLSLSQHSIGKSFHLLNPTSWNVRDLAMWMQKFGYAIQLMDYREWRKRAIRLATQEIEHPLHPVLSVFPEEVEQDLMKMPEFDRANVLTGLAGTDIVCPPVNDQLLSLYFTEYIRSGFLSPPTQATNTAQMQD